MSSIKTVMLKQEGHSIVSHDIFDSSEIIGDKRKRDETDSSNFESFDVNFNKYRRRSVLNLINDRSCGTYVDSNFFLEFSSMKVKQLTPTSCFQTVNCDSDNKECEFVRGSRDGKSIIALWKGSHYSAIIYRIIFRFSRTAQSCLSIPSVVQSIDQIGPFYALTHIRDMCDAQFRRQNCVLYVGNRTHREKMEGSTVLCNFTNSSYTYGRQYISKRYILSCAGSTNGEYFATGTEQGCYIFDDDRCTYKARLPGNVCSVEFNDSGKMLFCGVDTAGLTVFDLREPPWNRRTVRVNRFRPVGVSETKILSNEKSMIACGIDGTLSKIDFNKNDVVLKYEGHVGSTKKVPFSLDEAADLLCATGSDNLTRLWSLSTGKLLHTIRPESQASRSHSWLATHENRWFVAMFQKDKLYTYEPQSSF